MEKEKCALYFGSFNPVHSGHIGIASYVASMDEISQLRVIPSPKNPLKEVSVLADADLRLKEAVRSFSGISPKIVVSDVEYHLDPPLYTVKTLEYLIEKEPEKEFILVMGADNILTIERWYRWEDIMKMVRIWVYPRQDSIAARRCRLYSSRPEFKGVRYLEGAPEHRISSTMIREKRAISSKDSL